MHFIMQGPSSILGSLQHQIFILMKKSIEKKVADTILQTPEILKVGEVEYFIYPPSTATLIMVSEIISDMPTIDEDTENVLTEVLRVAKDMKVIGKIAAVLILGAKRIKEYNKVVVWRRVEKKKFNFWKMKYETSVEPTSEIMLEVDELAETLLDNLSSKQLKDLVSERLTNMSIPDFFGLTASLSAANLLKRTREAETTASGD